MAKPKVIELPGADPIPILYEDRAVLAIDKPAGWLLAPVSWQQTRRNLQAALMSCLAAGDFWARSRNLRYLRYVHRLDAETTGVLLLAKSPGALRALGELFETRRVEKTYLAVVGGVPQATHWTCTAKLGDELDANGRIRVDAIAGKPAETRFTVLATSVSTSLVRATPLTGRTHQVRVHLLESGHPVLGDTLYRPGTGARTGLALRAARLSYIDPFRKKRVEIRAPLDKFAASYGFEVPSI